MDIYQVKIELKGTTPPVWRRVLIKSNTKLSGLHQIIQDSMGWYNCHLHQFNIEGECFGDLTQLDTDWDEIKDEKKISLSKIYLTDIHHFTYEYDFGDGWIHEITIEKILPLENKTQYPICVRGRMACPPEDCGGIGGYYHLLEVLDDPHHDDYNEMLGWVGKDWNPKKIDLNFINARL